MANSNYQEAINNWTSRAATYKSLGIPTSDWEELAKTDLANVANNGSYPMSTSEVNAAILAKTANRSIIGAPTYTTSHNSLLGDIGDVFKSVPSDIGDIITGAPAGIAHLVMHLPSELTNTAKTLYYAADDTKKGNKYLESRGLDPDTDSFTGDFGSILRDFNSTLFGDLVPGMSDVANLTTPQGRQSLLNHPVGALLDVAPVGEVLGAGTRALTDAADEGSALADLQAGKPLKAGAKALSTQADKIPGVPDLYDTAAKKLASLGMNSDLAESLFRPKSLIDRRMRSQALDLYRNELEPLLDEKNNPGLREQLYKEATGLATPDPRHEAILNKVREMQNRLLKTGLDREALVEVPIPGAGGKTAIYDAGTPLIKLSRDASKLDDQVSRYRDLTKTHADRIEKAQKAIAEKQAERDAKIAERIARRDARQEKYLADHTEKMAKLKDKITAALFEVPVNRGKVQQLINDYTLADAIGPRVAGNVNSDISARIGNLTRSLQAATHDYRNASSTLRKLDRARMAARDRYDNYLASHPPANFHPYLVQKIRDDVIKTATDNADNTNLGGVGITASTLDAIAQRVNETSDEQTFKDILGDETYAQVKDDAMRSWINLARAGFDPIWLHTVNHAEYERIMYPSALPDKLISDADLSQFREKTFNFSPVVQDIAAGIMASAVEFLRQDGTNEFIGGIIEKYAQRKGDASKTYEDAARVDKRRPPNMSIAQYADMLFSRDFSNFSPEEYGVARGKLYSKQDQLVIPKSVADNLQRMIPKNKDATRLLPLRSSYDTTMRVFRFSVLTGPRHLAHVALGGLVALELQEPLAILQLAKAWAWNHEGAWHRTDERANGKPYLLSSGKTGRTNSLTDDVTHLEYGLPYELKQHVMNVSTDKIFQFASGGAMAKHLRQYWEASGQKLEDGFAKIESSAANMYRAAAYLSASKRGLDHEQAFSLANKVSVDMDAMAPIERTIIRQVFPFYAFTKFLFRFLLQFPVDYPYRAAILSRFGEQEQQDWNTLLPQSYQQLMFLGKPNANGNSLAVDFKNINPFRSFSSDFTMAGFFSNLNPILSAPLTLAGVSTLTGVTDLYPEVGYNATTGSLEAQPPPNRVFNLAEQFVPQLGVLDHFFGITNYMKTLKVSVPQPYRTTLFSNLNLPFAVSSVNVPYVEEHNEMNKYKAANDQLTYDEESGNFQSLREFQMVPFGGKLIPGNKLANQLSALEEQIKRNHIDVDPAALLVNDNSYTKTPVNPLELLEGTPDVSVQQ